MVVHHDIFGRERPTHIQYSPPDYVLHKMSLRVHLRAGFWGACGGVIAGFLGLLALWVLLLPVYYLTGWGVGPGEGGDQGLADNWRFLVAWFPFFSGVTSATYGMSLFRDEIEKERNERVDAWYRRQYPEDYIDKEPPK